jgi:opacity protein-like surface antigen
MRKSFIVIILLLLIAALPVAAQDVPKAELFGGYSWAGGNFHGWDTSVTANVNRWLGLTANFSGHYGHEQGGIIREQQRAISYLFGPRFTLRKNKRVTPFAYALFGGVNYNVRLTISGQTLVTATDTGFNLALGGGLDVKLNEHLSLRAFQLDYLRPNFFGESHNRGRLAFGLVLRLGKK